MMRLRTCLLPRAGGSTLLETSFMAKPRCDNCCFSTFAAGSGRAVLICRQKKGCEGRWTMRSPIDTCASFYPSRAAGARSGQPRLIPLTRGKFTIVDAEDYPHLSQYTWFAEGADKNCYAVRKAGGKTLKMHREITRAPDHLVVDHIDHDGLNNRKRNLRLCTFAENCRNTRRTAPSTSKYKGVHWNKRRKKWAASIRFDNKTYHLGCFDSELAAALAYDQAAKKYHGAFASLNFPDLATDAVLSLPVRCSDRQVVDSKCQEFPELTKKSCTSQQKLAILMQKKTSR